MFFSFWCLFPSETYSEREKRTCTTKRASDVCVCECCSCLLIYDHGKANKSKKRFDHRITKQMCLVKFLSFFFGFQVTRNNNIVVKQIEEREPNEEPKEYHEAK